MSDRLDDLVDRLAGSPTDRRLDGLEAEIGLSIGRHRRETRASAALTPVRFAGVGIALAMGVTAGGAAAMATVMSAEPLSVFSSSADLAPSNLLEGGK
jgi:hypothetical protein